MIRAQEAAPAPVAAPPEVRARIFPFELRPQAPDDELLELARASDANLFVDATDLSEQASAVPTRWTGKQDWALENLLIDIGAGRRLAWEIREADRALLFGPQPDLKELGQQMRESVGIEMLTPKMDEPLFNTRMAAYLGGDRLR